ncbi:serine/threonine protein phosphatase [Pacificimonas flava]|uniref:Serine/threonine protein phosphatase n=2 Tax=Pacificimonas TaxID=1960290 RepID=A0A219B113_9SPHN|nr:MULTISPECIES: metallophosphoesterase [Pacificimonas]MBZ6380044.1 metallophosphoesterase [Pacificimonas aurantium]OWV32015.1 serine/threonine protein phosphatase [Pacificimonas flava]
MTISRRGLMGGVGAMALGSILPMTNVRLAFADESQPDFTFAYISDSHIQHIKGTEFVRNWDRGLERAVAEANLMQPKPDFVLYGGDIAQLALPQEIDHGLEILSELNYPVHYVMGEHDYYLDNGEYWSKRLGPQWYSFDHKGVHFVVLNSILTYDSWMNKWSSGEERMGVMAGLDDPRGSPFMVGEEQRRWLKADLAKVDKSTPIVVASHSPLQKIFKNWNFWTEDAEDVQSLLQPFDKVTVLYGHVHQIQYNQIGNISFYSAMATAWPWPYPRTYAQAGNLMPELVIPMNRADPFFERDGTGWQFIDINDGRVAANYSLTENQPRIVYFDKERGHPVDAEYAGIETAPQLHY